MTMMKGLAAALIADWSDGLAVPGEREGWEERAAVTSDAVPVVHVILAFSFAASRRRA